MFHKKLKKINIQNWIIQLPKNTMQYVALLRGINVGGNNKIEMKKLKTVFEEAGLHDVTTYINSGNIVFQDAIRSQNKLVTLLEKAIFFFFLLSIQKDRSVAVFATALGYITAQYVAYHRQRKWLLRIAYLPFVASPVILATCLLFLWIKLRLAGTLFGVVLAQWMFAFSFAIIFFVPFWSPTIRATEELVYTLGGTARQALQKVLFPMSVSSLRICFFQTFLMSWVQYGVTLMVGGGKVQTLPVLVYFYVNEANITFAAMASFLLTLPPLLLLAFNKQYLWNTHG